MSSTTAISNSNLQVVSSNKTPHFSSTISTTARSSAATVTASAKKTRKSEIDGNNGGTNFLPIAPHQTFFSPNQGLTLASVQQQQQLHSGGVAVFSSPTMMATQQQGPQAGQQLVVTAQGQPMTQTFNTANGQGLIQASPQQMQMIQGLQQMQMIQAGPGQPTYTLPIHQVYTNHGMQPMLLGHNLTMAFQQNPSQLAIQIPNGQVGSTMITTNQLANTPTTPVKPSQPQGQTIIKSVAISPQQPQATKSSASSTPTAVRGQTQQNQQQTLIQQTFQQAGQQNQAFVIGTFQSSNPGQANGATILSTPTNNRKNAGTARSSSAINPKGQGTNIIQKIQPATSLATSPIIAPAQFKSNTSPFQTATNANSPANGQTIMVHGQGIQSGTGGIQLAPNQTIISPFQPGITWTTGPSINQQPTQLVTPNGQPIFIRSQSGEQPQMFIQTSNNQFQALPMQMATGGQQQGTTPGGTVQMTAGQSLVGSSVNQSMPIIQTNQAVTPTAIVSQQATTTPGNNMLTSTTTSQSNTTVSTPLSNAHRQRPIRPAGNTVQLATSTQAMAGKQKVSLDSRNANQNILGIAKLAPKTGTVTNGPGQQVNTVSRTSLANQQAKLPLTMTKASDGQNLVPKTPPSSAGAPLSTSNKAVPKVSMSTTTQNTAATSVSSSTPLSVSSSMASTVITSTGATLVTNVLAAQNNRSSSPASSLNKVNRKSDKKDSSTGPIASPLMHSINKPIKSGLNGIRTSTAAANKSATTANAVTIAPNTQMINGVLCQLPAANAQVKTSITNGPKAGVPNGTVSKSVGIGVQKGLSTPKSKPKQQENLVLTHVIDGYIIQESPNPFPINGYTNSIETDNQKDKNSLNAKEPNETETKTKGESKENALNGAITKEMSTTVNGGLKVTEQQPQQQTPGSKSRVASGCLSCGKKEAFKNGKDKLKKFCSAACNEAFSQKKALQNGTAPMSVQMMAKVASQPPILSNSVIPSVPVIPDSTLPTLPPGQTVATTFQQMNGMKRSIKDSNGPAPDKKARVNSPITAKNDLPQSASKPQQNGGQSDSKESSPVKETKADVLPELEGLWLPPGGKDPNKWTIQDVYDFINNLEGCSGCAEEFRTHEIDGQALMFINEEHIITILHMKLGPALKICRKIKDLKSAFNI